ncbi:MAG: PQQ-dependent sugar dehydrogenase, partial [Myxococcota bacterium]
DLDQPVALATAGDDRLFVAERAGRILIVESDGSVLDPYLEIQSAVDSSVSEQGLLGLAFHPGHASNGFFYVYYTVDPGPGLDRSRVSRFTVSADPNVADPASEVVLLEFEQPYANHNAGDIQFGPDGYLYIASGDGGSGGDPLDLGQTTSSPLGKILRIDVDGSGGAPDCDLSGGANYRVPPGNAFDDGSGGAGCDEIWALGLRNPWRFSFDRATGDLWIGDVGQNAFEEIDFIPAGTASGLNLGWRCYEGESEFNTAGCGSGYFMPIHTPAHSTGNCSITGGFVYRGAAEPGLTGRYFFTDFCNTAIRTVTRNGSEFLVDEVLPAGAIAQPVAFGEDSAGELYIASLAGDVFRIRDNSPREVPALAPWSVLALAAAILALPLAGGWVRAARRNPGRPPHP